MDRDRRSVVVRSAVSGLIVLVVLLTVYLAFSGWAAMQSLRQASSQLSTAQNTLEARPEEAQRLVEQARGNADSAASTLSNPVWTAVAGIPYFGATPQGAAVVAKSLSQALAAVQPSLVTLNQLNPTKLVKDGRIDVLPVQEAVPVAEAALPGLREAQETLETFPEGGMMLGSLQDAHVQLDQQITSMRSTLKTAVTFGKIASPLLGQDGDKRYFLGLLNPNEARGTGGFLGTYAILTASDGALTVDQIGSNTDLPDLAQYPTTIGDEFRARYGDDPLLRGNMNLSPHFPDTAQLWLEAWKQKTGETLDGAMALDVMSLGDLVTASGRTVDLPDGQVLTGTQLSQFVLRDIYARYPNPAERKLYQEQAAASALQVVTTLPKPVPMATAFGRGLSQGRIVIWSADTVVEKELDAAGVGGSIEVGPGNNVKVVLLNSSGSKLDAWLRRSAAYDVGQCPTDNGQVESSVRVNVRSDVPLGTRPPTYMIGQARTGANGPINSTFVQIYLPDKAQLRSVSLDGKDAGRFTFTEHGRPAVLIAIDLPPRVTKRISVSFTEPFDDGEPQLEAQPLASEMATEIRDGAACP